MAKSTALAESMSDAIGEMAEALGEVGVELADAVDTEQVVEVVRSRRRPLLRLIVLLAVAGIGVAVARKLMSRGTTEVEIDLVEEPAQDAAPAA
jgi:hypothetical protein